MTPAVVLCASELAHGVVEGQAEDLDVEVNGIAGQIAFGPAPVAVFDDESGIGGQNIVACVPSNEFKFALLEQRHQWREPGGADLFARPKWALRPTMRRWVGHSLFSNGVE